MTTRPRRLELIDLIRELTQTTNHRELYIRKRAPRYHVTSNPPLLVQLKAAATPNPAVEAGTTRPAASKPSAAIDCIDTLNRITQQATTWLQELHHPNPNNVIRTITQLGALAPNVDHCGRRTPRRDPDHQVRCCTNHRIEADTRRWWTWARIATRWDLPPWQPHNTCPYCGTLGALRIRLADQIATCTNDDCRMAWDETTIGLLAVHIRTENHDYTEAS